MNTLNLARPRAKQGLRIALPLLTALLLTRSATLAQVTTKVSSVSPQEAFSNSPITISVELRQGETIEHVYLVYRPFGESQYSRVEMDLIGNTASATLASKFVIPPFIEYYIVLVDRGGTMETYPLSESTDPFTTPPERTLRLPVRQEEDVESGIVFLSPEQNSTVSQGDVLISLSLLRVDSVVVQKATQVYLDGADVTAKSVFSEDIVVYSPENFGLRLVPGLHRVGVRLYDRSGNLYRTASLIFTVRPEGEFAYAEPTPGWFTYGATVNMESRHESVDSVGTWYNRGGYQFTGKAGDWRLVSNAFVTSDEKSDRQPQDRFFIGVESPWIRAGYGDSYPSFPDLILSGKRVRGLNSSLTLGGFNLDIALGSTTRAVEGSLLQTFPADSLNARIRQDSINGTTGNYGRIDSLTYGRFSYGTYSRSLLAVRPSFGSKESFQIGFTLLNSKDDLGSIRYGVRPQEDLVVGADFTSKFDRSRIEFSGQAAFSAFNSDISSGTFTDAYIDSTYPNDKENVRQVRDILKSVITVNDNLRPLSLHTLSTVAYDLELGLRYFDNVFKLGYLYRGSDYNSFGQTFLRKDIQGFNAQDRMRIVENRVFVTLGYERLQDNTSHTKAATTTYSTLNMAVTYYPRMDAPNVTVGYSRYANDNGLPNIGPDSLSVIDDATNRVFVQSSYDVDWGARHTASLSFSTSDRSDNSPRQLNVKNLTVALGLTSRYQIPLQTSVDFSVNRNSLPTGILPGQSHDINYTMLGVRGRYEVIEKILIASAGVSPTFGDFRRTVIDLGGEYYILPTMSLNLQFSYFNNEGMPQDNFVSLRFRYDI